MYCHNENRYEKHIDYQYQTLHILNEFLILEIVREVRIKRDIHIIEFESTDFYQIRKSSEEKYYQEYHLIV